MAKNVFKSVTDERLIIDVMVPGYGKDMVTVKSARVNGGDAFKVTVEGTYKPRTNKAGNPVPAAAFEKHIEPNFKYTFSDDANFADQELFRSPSGTFNTKDYDLDALTWDCKDGVIRISIPKTEIAMGKVVEATDNADADSTGAVD